MKKLLMPTFSVLQHQIGPFLREVFMAIVNRIFTVLGKPADEKDVQVSSIYQDCISEVQQGCVQGKSSQFINCCSIFPLELYGIVDCLY